MAHARVQPRTLRVAQAVRASPWADTGTPANLIDEQVAQPSDDRLIGEPGLEPPTAGEQTIELRARYLERVGAKHREQALERRAIVQQSHALQLAQVAIAKLAAIEREDDAIVAMNQKSRPGKRSRAKAKPAIEQVISWPKTTKKVIFRLLVANARKGTVDWKTAA